MNIIQATDRSVERGPADWFTGEVLVDVLFTPETRPEQRARRSPSRPEPERRGTRTRVGQTLIVTAGVGRVQREGGPIEAIRPGDVVWFSSCEKHWHGAAPHQAVTHIAVQEAQDGRMVQWLEHVTDDQYLG